ncbi:MAG TPA: cell division protein FtsL [Terriglobales bacterium]|nr:cell division protein FtsL [Terriglobales bacterium]
MASITIPAGAAALLDPLSRKINSYCRPRLEPVARKIGERLAPRAVEERGEDVPTAMRGTPEIFFHKHIDNSRLVRVVDRRRAREMMQFAAACALLFVFAMVYAWQHFSAIEYGYKIETARSQVETLSEQNNQLRLEQAALRDPQRIDQMARNLGMIAPQVGQVVGLEPAVDGPAAQMARAGSPSAAVAP